jgi:TRAP-type C4-dicarboxylate transport system permease small subunit
MLVNWLRARADDVAAGLLAAIFATFIFQIFARYVMLRFYPGINIGWTVELCLTLWIWAVFWGTAFCVRESDHVRFDILYLAMGKPARRVMAITAALVIAGAMLAALPATWDYITFYKIKKSAVLKWRLDYVFSIYGVFAVAIISRNLWRAMSIIRGETPDTDDLAHDLTAESEEAYRR